MPRALDVDLGDGTSRKNASGESDMTEANVEGKSTSDSKKLRIGRTPRAIIVVSVAVVLVVLAYYLLAGVITPSAPYPSDDTPMSTFEGGVVWECRLSDMTSVNILDVPFSNVSFFIAYPNWGQSFEDAQGYGSGVINESRAVFTDFRNFDYGDSGSFQTSGEDTAQGIVWSTFWILITDQDTNGRWSPGDNISVFSCLTLNEEIVKNGFVNDTEYAFAIHFEPAYPLAHLTVEYHFAFHKGEFYSWIPDRMLSIDRG